MEERPVIGFTGTQRGMTTFQRSMFERLIDELQFKEFHHGDCVGSDRQAHNMVRRLGIQVVIHPPDNASKRAFCSSDIILPYKPYLERNRDIVDICDVLIATPDGNVEKLRSGTWATIRYARKCKKSIIIIYPTGNLHRENC